MSSSSRSSSRWRPPRSGALVGFLVDLLDLRRVEPETGIRVLSDSQARAYFSGVADDSVDLERRSEIFRAVARTLFDSKLVERWPGGASKDEPLELLTEAVRTLAVHADRCRSETEAPCPSLPDSALAREQPIRFAAVDLAVRAAGALALHGVSWIEFQAWWGRTEKRGAELRHIIKADGPTRTTRDRLAAVARVDPKTVDAWLDGVRRPTRENIRIVAAHLGALNGEGETRVRRRLEWHWIACDIRDAVTRWTDDRQSSEIAGAFGEYVTRTLGHLQVLPNAQATSALSRVFLATGTWPFLDRGSPRKLIHAPAGLFDRLLASEKHPLWRATLAHAGRDVPHGMHEWARCMSSYDAVAEQLGAREGRNGLDPDGVRAFVIMTGFLKTALHGVPMPWHIPALSRPDDPKTAALEHLHRLDGAMRASDYKAAEAHAFRAVELQPDDPWALFCLGSALWPQGKTHPALIALRDAARLEPTNVAYRREIGLALNAAGRSKEAIDEIEMAIRDIGGDPWLVATLAWFRSAAGEVEGVGKLWEEAARGLPDDGTLLSDAARFLLKNGDRRTGRRYAKAAAKLGYSDVLRELESGEFDRGGSNGADIRGHDGQT